MDELGGLSLAISIAKSRAGLDPDEETDIVVLPKRIPLWYRLISGDALFLARALSPAPLMNVAEITERLANDKMFYLMPYTISYE